MELQSLLLRRGQGEWTFSKDTTGSFILESMKLAKRLTAFIAVGWITASCIFVAWKRLKTSCTHVKSKDDADVVIDRIYDIYYVDWDNPIANRQPLETQVVIIGQRGYWQTN